METADIQGYRLSPQQTRLWRWMARGGGPFHAQTSIAVEGSLEAGAARDALLAIVNRHAALRTTFRMLPGLRVPFQIVADEGEPSWREADLSGLDAARQRAAAGELEAEEFERPFDTERDTPVRALLVRLAADRHLLVITLPALCADSQSLQSLFRQFAESCAPGAAGAGAADGALFQYPDFAAWQWELLEPQDEEAQAGFAHWRRQSALPASALALPFETRRGAGETRQSARVAAELDGRLAARLGEVAASHASSLKSLLLAAWQTLLYRFNGDEQVVTGYTPGERKYEELSGACGLFAQRLPLGNSVAAESSFAEVLRRAEESARECEEWEEFYSEQEAGQEQTLEAGLPVGFEYLERAPDYSAAGLTFRQLRLHSHSSPFKIKLSAARRGDSLSLELHYDAGVFRAADVALVGRCFEALLRDVAERPGAAVGGLNLLADADRRSPPEATEGAAADFPAHACFHHLFEEQAARVPTNTALVCGTRRLTYAELNARANRLARVLRRMGAGPETPVCLLMDRSAGLIVSILGVFKAGAAYVPLNPDDPAPRLRQQIEGTGATLVIADEGLRDLLDGCGCRLIRPDGGGDDSSFDDDDSSRDDDETNLEGASLPESLAYVIHTSGSTGAPKGVAVTHRSLVNYVHFIRTELGCGADAGREALSFATVSTVSADLGNTAIFPALATGGCLHVVGYETATDGGAFAEYAARHAIDVLKIVPSHLGALMASAPERVEGMLPRRWLILGGEPLAAGLAARLRSLPGSRRVINHYGPTEATVGSLTFDLGQWDERAGPGPRVPIGRPVANTRAYVLDERLGLVPPGVVGELYIGGEGLARGYLNAAGPTAERFVPDPFSREPGRRLYRTGDLTRRLPDGNVEFVGRRDEQVKIRGYRIEPAEVTAALREAPGVREAFVTTGPDAQGENRLVAYVVTGEARPPDVNRLRDFLKLRLPEYMLPAAFVALEAMPLTSNGKINRRALPAPGKAQSGREYVGPRTEAEEVLTRLWQEVLRVGRVGVFDNFFELGGDSIAAIQVVARANAAGLRFTVRNMFEHQTVAALAERAEAAQPAAAGTAESPDPQLDRESLEQILGAVNFET